MIYDKASTFLSGLSQLMLGETQFSAIKSLMSEILRPAGINAKRYEMYNKIIFEDLAEIRSNGLNKSTAHVVLVSNQDNMIGATKPEVVMLACLTMAAFVDAGRPMTDEEKIDVIVSNAFCLEIDTLAFLGQSLEADQAVWQKVIEQMIYSLECFDYTTDIENFDRIVNLAKQAGVVLPNTDLAALFVMTCTRFDDWMWGEGTKMLEKLMARYELSLHDMIRHTEKRLQTDADAEKILVDMLLEEATKEFSLGSVVHDLVHKHGFGDSKWLSYGNLHRTVESKLNHIEWQDPGEDQIEELARYLRLQRFLDPDFKPSDRKIREVAQQLLEEDDHDTDRYRRILRRVGFSLEDLAR